MPQGTPIVAFLPGSTDFHFLVRESDGYLSRDEITIASGQGKLKGGTIISKSGSTYVGWATGMTNAAILAQDVDATSAAVKATAFVWGVEVQRAELFFVGTPTTPQKAEAYGVLAAQRIVMR
jgi:hypothetical protein